MKRAILLLVCLLVCSMEVFATVDFIFSYDVYLHSYYRKDGTDYRRTAQSHNANASTLLNGSYYTPYNGGSDYQHRNNLDQSQLVALYLSRTGVSNWTTNEIIGTLAVGSSMDFPEGSLVPFEVSYEYVEVGGNTAHPDISGGVSLWQNDFLREIYSVSGNTTKTDIIHLTAGEEYAFYAWYLVGTSAKPFSGRFIAGILYDIAVIPEPAAITFMLLGVCGLCKQKKLMKK